MTSNRFMFTQNNPEGAIVTDDWEAVRCAVWQLEVGEQGTPHYQGYIVYKRSCRFPTVKRLLGQDPHIDIARGTQAQCIAYCTKEETRVEGPYWFPDEATVRGSVQGTRSDLKTACDQIVAGAAFAEIDTVTWARNNRGLLSLYAIHHPAKMRDNVKVLCIHGAPGLGKSTAVWTQCAETPFRPQILETGTIWFDGYCGQSTLFLDDYKGQLPIHVFNSICDRFPYNCPVKGGFIGAAWTVVIICTNVEPSDWYAKFGQRQDEVGAVYRRIGYGEWADKDPDHRYVNPATREELLSMM